MNIWNSLRWPIYIINSVDETKLSCYTPRTTEHHNFFGSLPPYSIKVGMAPQYITAYTIYQRCSHSPWVDNRENLHSYWLSSLLLLAWVSLLHVTHFLSELIDLRKLFSLLTWRTVVQQLVSCPKSVIIHVCIIGHKHHPQAFVQWIKFYRSIPWCTT